MAKNSHWYRLTKTYCHNNNNFTEQTDVIQLNKQHHNIQASEMWISAGKLIFTAL